MQGLCIGFAIGCAVVAVWGAVYMWLLRPRLIGRKRLAHFNPPKSTSRYYEDKVVSVVGEGERTELPYHDLPWEKIYVGEHAIYLELKLLSLFAILRPEDFTVGDPDAFPAFLWEKAGLPAKDIT